MLSSRSPKSTELGTSAGSNWACCAQWQLTESGGTSCHNIYNGWAPGCRQCVDLTSYRETRKSDREVHGPVADFKLHSAAFLRCLAALLESQALKAITTAETR